MIDLNAIRIPQRSRVPPCLYLPIAARSIESIEKFVGSVQRVLSQPKSKAALLVNPYHCKPEACKLPIWQHQNVNVLNQLGEVWVQVDYKYYRNAYLRAYPETDRNLVLDHVLNRREARLKGFEYLRLVPISRAVNSSHGGLSERWGVDYHNSPEMRKINNASKAEVQYADLTNIIKMMDIQGGGGLMENANTTQKLVAPEPNSKPCKCFSTVPHYSELSSNVY